MAIEIQETFQVEAPVEAVWQFVMDPHKVVTCMPGAQLDEVVDDNTFLGSIKVKVGPITTSYKGRVQLTQVDEQGHVLQMAAEGRETSGGMAKGTMTSRLRSLPNGETEVVAEARVDLTGRIMQVGRGMIQGVSHQLFAQFAARLKEQLEAPEAAAKTGPTSSSQESVRVAPLLLKAMWSAVVSFFRRLFGETRT
jgi:carbon monoxide dehydrogenase subunit G